METRSFIFDELKEKIENADEDELQELWRLHKPKSEKVIQLFSERKKSIN